MNEYNWQNFSAPDSSSFCGEVTTCFDLKRAAAQGHELPTEFNKFFQVVMKNVKDIASLQSRLTGIKDKEAKDIASVRSSLSRNSNRINALEKGKNNRFARVTCSKTSSYFVTIFVRSVLHLNLRYSYVPVKHI